MLFCGLAALSCSGCIQGSLATRTGPNGPQLWSADDKQDAHVGETVEYSLILVSPLEDRPINPLGLADYCVADIGGRRLVCEPDLEGHFRFEQTMEDVQAGETVQVLATAYRQYGTRDFVAIGDKWLRGDSPIDEPDRAVCDDDLKLRIYQSRVELHLPAGPSTLDLESGKLQLFKEDGEVVNVFVDRPIRRGFTAEGPDESGAYKIVYLPGGEEVNPSGTTRALFVAYDSAGHQHTAETTIPTP